MIHSTRNWFLLFIAFVIGSLFSCGTTEPIILSSKSPDQTCQVKISATQTVIGDPWKIIISRKSEDKWISLPELELEISTPSSKNVLFEWTSNEVCIITFIFPDGKTYVLTQHFNF